MLTALTGDRLMGVHEIWGSCGPCAAGIVENWTGMSHVDFATLNASLPQELFPGERAVSGFQMSWLNEKN
jgi:hypothetical protein